MYERFSDRARKVMQLANQEAQRLNHESVDTEHVLLGLVKEGSGHAAHVLRSFDIDLRTCRLEVEKLVQAGSRAAKLGKLPQTPRVQEIIQLANGEARKPSHGYVDTQHLLLGLMRDNAGVAAQVLLNLGLSLDDVRSRALDVAHTSCAMPSFRTSYAELGRLPAKTVRKLIRLDSKREQLKLEAEAAIAGRDFKKADRLRGRIDRLHRDRAQLLQEARPDPPSSPG